MLTRRPNILQDKTSKLMGRIVKMIAHLRTKHNVEASWINQLSRSGTSIGANIAESKNAQSRADFVSKLNIALKEADETKYWIDIIHQSGGLNDVECSSITRDVNEVIYLLTSIIKTTKANGL